MRCRLPPGPLALIAFAALSCGPTMAVAVELLPHRTTYRLSLLGTEEPAGIVSVEGAMVVEWQAACDGWLSQQRLGFVARAEAGPGLTYDSRYSSWEARDFTAMRFDIRTFDGAKLEEEFRGEARLDGVGGKGRVEYAVPTGETAALPSGTMFPTAHLHHLVAAAQAGEWFVTREVFDGSGEDPLTLASAVIGPARHARSADGLTIEQRWPVSLAYFALPGSDEDMLPEFEITFSLSEGGIFHDVMLDFGDFRLKADLERLERLEHPRCD